MTPSHQLEIAGKTEARALIRERHSERRRTGEMLDFERRHLDAAPLERRAWLKLAKPDFERARRAGDGGIKRLHHIHGAPLDTLRPEDFERLRPALHEHPLQHEKGHAAEMIAMAVADDDGVHRVEADARAFQRERRIRAAIEHQPAVGGIEQIAAMEASARVEGVAASDDSQFHWGLRLCERGGTIRPRTSA